jgi:hypothetical protein
MVCTISCIIAFTILVASIYMMLTPEEETQKLMQVLDKETLEYYKEVKLERFSIYIEGLIVGLIIALIYLLMTDGERATKICMFASIALITQILYYEMKPKKNWLVKKLKTDQQREIWHQHYVYMKTRWHYGVVIGLASYAVLAYALTK